MRPLVIFYSRTGNTRNLAEMLAASLDAELAQIHCHRYGTGPWSYLRAGYDSVTGSLPTIDVPPEARSPHKHVLIGGPVWTSHPATPIRRYLTDYGDIHESVARFATYGGHSPADTAFAEMATAIKNPAVAKLAINGADLETTNAKTAINTFVSALGAEWSALR